jgi:hypothetical protein
MIGGKFARVQKGLLDPVRNFQSLAAAGLTTSAADLLKNR